MDITIMRKGIEAEVVKAITLRNAIVENGGSYKLAHSPIRGCYNTAEIDDFKMDEDGRVVFFKKNATGLISFINVSLQENILIIK